MSNEKALEAIGHGLSFATSGVHRLVIGEEVIGLQDSKDMCIPSATFEGLENFVRARREYILKRAHETHLKLNTRKVTATLMIGEHGHRKLVGDINTTPVVIITATSRLSGDFIEVQEAMDPSGHEVPRDIAEQFRTSPYLFESVDECIRVVKALKNVNVKISQIIQDTENDAKSREKRMKMDIDEGQIDIRWNFRVPVFEGLDPQLFPVMARFEVQDDFRSVNLVILDASGEGIRTIKRNIERRLMETCIADVGRILGDESGIPMIYVDEA